MVLKNVRSQQIGLKLLFTWKVNNSEYDGNRQVVFFDELPWLDVKNSFFTKAFESFWNSFGCDRENLMVIVCGMLTHGFKTI